MPVIRIDTAQIDSTGSQFFSKRSDLDGLVSQSRSLMKSLEGQFTGQRANAIFSEWESLQPNLQAAMVTLQQAGDLLKKASQEFAVVDSSR
jgi:WXG100 family type VII secretion target